MRLIPSFIKAIIVVAALSLSGCGEGDTARPGAATVPAVTIVRARSAQIKPSTVFTGRIEARDKVELRARIDGFLEKRLFVEGADVKPGDLLFTIESAPYQAAANRAQAELAKAQAALELASIEFDRQKELVSRNSGTQARLDEATAKHGQARGEVEVRKAELERAQLDLGYAKIAAPMAGRIGRASVSVGGLVGPGTGTLATIVSQDPVYVNFPVTQREILAIRKETAGKPDPEYTVYLQLADGSRYAKSGELDFLDVTVNRGTDTVLARAVFPNPDRFLVDGQLVSVIAEAEAGESAVLVPQKALQVDQGGPFLLVVDKDDRVQIRRIESGPVSGADLTVRKGLSAGERVIVERVQQLRPGEAVQVSETQPGA
ncbi:efflux RND transporter periplasmic adaptor subunit [Bradyrhizobium sp.]|uniref:efflux RND transporter periplasmic adaptor subunit n=1 Tax=Bradyrhizobium sp. TaxID=376 RepID=UPI004037B7D5